LGTAVSLGCGPGAMATSWLGWKNLARILRLTLTIALTKRAGLSSSDSSYGLPGDGGTGRRARLRKECWPLRRRGSLAQRLTNPSRSQNRQMMSPTLLGHIYTCENRSCRSQSSYADELGRPSGDSLGQISGSEFPQEAKGSVLMAVRTVATRPQADREKF